MKIIKLKINIKPKSSMLRFHSKANMGGDEAYL
jgi:hypothetical protein